MAPLCKGSCHGASHASAVTEGLSIMEHKNDSKPVHGSSGFFGRGRDMAPLCKGSIPTRGKRATIPSLLSRRDSREHRD